MAIKTADPFLGLTWDEMRVDFDPVNYTRLYSDVKISGMDPFEHYVNFGWLEDRVPMRGFDVEYYRDRHMANTPKACPLAHFSAVGRSSKFAVNKDQEHFDTWLDTKETAWQDELGKLLGALGYDSRRFANDAFGLYVRNMFSPKAYRAAKGLDKTVSDTECFVRYLVFDFETGMPPGPKFDGDAYLKKASAKGLLPLAQNQTPFEHWLHRGIDAGITPSDLFSGSEYIDLNPDLKSFPRLLYSHFLLHGLREKRQFMREVVIASNPAKSNRQLGEDFIEKFGSNRAALDELGAMRAFRKSADFKSLLDQACKLDPDVTGNMKLPGFIPPWHDDAYHDFKAAIDELPEGKFDAVVLVPFCKVGGADYVAGILSRTLSDISGSVLVIQTDQSDWARPEWFGDVERADLSTVFSDLAPERKTQILYEVLRYLRPKDVFNVNSRLAFDTIVRFGKQMKTFTRLHAYYFCADRTKLGVEVGYPVWYFANVFEHLTTAIADSADLATTLSERYCLTPDMRKHLVPVYTPAKEEPRTGAIVDAQITHASRRSRQTVIWAGRFDRQKRFDILVDVATKMPDVDFLCWGKAVLDDPPDLSSLPSNLRLNEPFKSYDELPLIDADGFFYTSDWDGIPTILIELGGFGVPIVASASGGVPELITPKTGWTVPVGSSIDDYVAAIKEMLSNSEERRSRAKALQVHVREQHSEDRYAKALKSLMGVK